VGNGAEGHPLSPEGAKMEIAGLGVRGIKPDKGGLREIKGIKPD
jgi:hypothetical protein